MTDLDMTGQSLRTGDSRLHDITWLTGGSATPPERRVLDAKNPLEAAEIYNAAPAPTPTVERNAKGGPVALGILGVVTTPIPKPEGW